MAFTVTTIEKNVVGKLRQHLMLVTADAASGEVDTGLSNVYGFSASPVSAATAAPKFRRNLDNTSATAYGKIMVSSAASGDDFFIIAFGV